MPTETSATGSSPGGASRPLDPSSVEGIFVEALEKESGQQRSDFLAEACQAKADLRSRVEALLRAYDDSGSFLQQAAGDWRNPPMAATSAGPSVDLDDNGIPRGLLRPSDKPDVLGTIGPYEVRELIGRGGMGVVLRAFDAKLNRIVAIKVLAPELASQPAARRRFLREAQAAAAVAHPHVVTIHAVDEDEWPYLVMECIGGISLQEKIERVGTLKLAEVLRIGTQIAEGLTAAHKQGLIHRDVKPANILLENGVERVKITDFGLARAADDVTITRPGEISGTPQYMSPEQASGERVDQRSDLFSLGCVLYAMCAGRPPFRADSVAAIVKKICHDTPQPLHEIDQQIPQWLAELIDRLLAKDPQERFQTAEEVASILGGALAQVQAGQAVTGEVMHPRASKPEAQARHPRLARATKEATSVGVQLPSGASSSLSRPWKVAGWLVVVLLSLVLLVPVLLAIALIVPYYQARQSTEDMRVWQAQLAHLTMTFDEDLPIVDIQIDGTSCGPIEISPVVRDWSAGPRTITVVYTNGDRKRSVRHTVNLVAHENRTLDLTPLVAGDIDERAKQKSDSKRAKEAQRVRASPSPSTTESPAATGDKRDFQLDCQTEPKKETYRVGDLIKVTLSLRNLGNKPITTAMPRNEVLEKLGLDIDFGGADGSKLPWRWGRAHKRREELTVSGAISTTLQPNVPFELPPFVVAVGATDKEGATVDLPLKTATGQDDLPPQTVHLTFKVSSIGIAGGDELELASEPLKFQIVAQ